MNNLKIAHRLATYFANRLTDLWTALIVKTFGTDVQVSHYEFMTRRICTLLYQSGFKAAAASRVPVSNDPYCAAGMMVRDGLLKQFDAFDRQRPCASVWSGAAAHVVHNISENIILRFRLRMSKAYRTLLLPSIYPFRGALTFSSCSNPSW